MPVYESRTQRSQNTYQLEAKHKSARRMTWWVALGVFGVAVYVIGRGVWRYESLFVLLGACSTTAVFASIFAFVVDGLIALQEVDEDEIEYRTMAHDAAPGDARLMVRTTPQQVTLADVGLKNYERLAIGYTFEREGWKWRRDPIFRKAGITNYAARYKAITEAVQDAGMLDGLGMVRQEYRAWFTSPTPQVIDSYAIDGADDDAVVRGERCSIGHTATRW